MLRLFGHTARRRRATRGAAALGSRAAGAHPHVDEPSRKVAPRRFLRAAGRWLAVVAMAGVTSGHVGSPDTWFRGKAGPYDVQVVVRLPGVVPGLAQVDISVEGDGVERVTAQPVIADAGPEGAPPADVAKPIPGRPGQYHAELWFMQAGSFSVTVGVKGTRGEGRAVVPVAAVPERQIPLYPWLGWLLAALGTLLFVGAVTIFRAAGSDGITAPGVAPSPATRRAGRIYAVGGAVLLGLGLNGARNWWNSVEREYQSELYRPYAASAAVDTTGGERTLRFVITDSVWQSRRARNSWERFSLAPLAADHGKVMHLFLIGYDSARTFAHLHPAPSDANTFHSALGALPAGRYRAYADIVHESGFPQTLVAELDVPPGSRVLPLGDPDDAVFEGHGTGDAFTLPDGATITRERRPSPLVPLEDAGLRFVVREADGRVARLSPYLGMPGHAVVFRHDGSVYIHLHPNGTISMVAQQALEARSAGQATTAPGTTHGMHDVAFDGTLAFPYAFPRPGTYRVWVQVRRPSGIATAPFDLQVQ